MWYRPNSSIKTLDLRNTLFAKNLFFLGDFAISSTQMLRKRFSKLNNEFAMPFLYDQIGQNLPTNIEQSMSCNDPFITIPFKKFIPGFFKGCRASSLKRFLQPMKKSNVGVRYLKDTSIVAIFVSIARFVFELAGVKTSLSVDDSSKISEMNRIVNFGFIKNAVFMVFVVELHISPNVYRFTNQYTPEISLSPG